jgi:hypothetical protein
MEELLSSQTSEGAWKKTGFFDKYLMNVSVQTNLMKIQHSLPLSSEEELLTVLALHIL